MWNRKELKEKGKAAVKRNYWKSVLVSAIFAAAVGGAGVCSNSAANTQNNADVALESAGAVIGFAVIMVLALAAVALIYVLLVNPFTVGVNKFRLNALQDKGNVSDMGTGFDVSYKRNVKVMFFRDLYTILWTILFIIPGIVKAYEYRMIPYLLADNPDMDKAEAFTRSMQMMKGNKWRSFVLDLSFILWAILGVITFGIVNVLWVDPYKQLTDAALYNALKAE